MLPIRRSDPGRIGARPRRARRRSLGRLLRGVLAALAVALALPSLPAAPPAPDGPPPPSRPPPPAGPGRGPASPGRTPAEPAPDGPRRRLDGPTPLRRRRRHGARLTRSHEPAPRATERVPLAGPRRPCHALVRPH